MKKSINMNLSGQIFHIDEDAYRLLENYLESLKYHFNRSGDDPEIVQEFESRIAEHLLAQSHAQSRVVSIELVSQVIELMGRPEEIFDSEELKDRPSSSSTATDAGTHSSSASAQYNIPNPQTVNRRKLYRDIDNAKLCGVISGLAAYWGWNRGAMRLVFIVGCILLLDNWIVVPLLAYLAAWMIIPAAETATQKLEMWGKPISTETIGEHVRSEAMQPSVDKSTQRMMGCFSAGCITTIGITVLGLGFLTILARLSSQALEHPDFPLHGFVLEWDSWYAPMPMLVISMILVLLIPLLFWLYPWLTGRDRNEVLPTWVRITGTIVWGIAVGVFMYCFVKAFIYGGTNSWLDFLHQQHRINLRPWQLDGFDLACRVWDFVASIPAILRDLLF